MRLYQPVLHSPVLAERENVVGVLIEEVNPEACRDTLYLVHVANVFQGGAVQTPRLFRAPVDLLERHKASGPPITTGFWTSLSDPRVSGSGHAP